MYAGLVHAHSGLRWVVLLLLFVTIITAISRLQKRQTFLESHRKLALFTLIANHLQLLIGLILFFISPKVNMDLISDKIYRFFTLEHTLGMILAIILITLGYGKSKRSTNDSAKFRSLAIYFGIALLIILISIPWPFRQLGASLF